MKIESNFTDYYDELLKEVNTDIVYSRLKDNSLSRRKALGKLREWTDKVVDCELCRNTLHWNCEQVMVYMKPNTHKMEERVRVDRLEAIKYYPNYLCTPYYPVEVTGGFTYKTLVVGRRQFSLIFSKCGADIDYEGELSSYKELEPRAERLCDRDGNVYGPIYSMDYVKVGEVFDLKAIDFNEVQRISFLKYILTPEEIVEEIKWFYNIE